MNHFTEIMCILYIYCIQMGCDGMVWGRWCQFRIHFTKTNVTKLLSFKFAYQRAKSSMNILNFRAFSKNKVTLHWYWSLGERARVHSQSRHTYTYNTIFNRKDLNTIYLNLQIFDYSREACTHTYIYRTLFTIHIRSQHFEGQFDLEQFNI